MKVDKIVDQFLSASGISRSLLSQAPWITEIENRLPTRFPPSFSSLVTRYRFESFDAGPIRFLGNMEVGWYDEMSEAIFRDPVIFRVTSSNGFIHFAGSSDGSYDPVCFDMRSRPKSGEFPVVRIDHEAILQHDQIRVVVQIPSSLLEFMQDRIARLTVET